MCCLQARKLSDYRVLKKDKIIYKIFIPERSKSGLKSPFKEHQYHYNCWEVAEIRGFENASIGVYPRRKHYFGLHGFRTKRAAEKYTLRPPDSIIVPCLVPKGTRVVYGSYKEIVVEKLKPLKNEPRKLAFRIHL